MQGIEMKKDIILYYGNKAGYVENGTAVVDNMFKGDELTEFLQSKTLTAKWTDGVFDKLATGAKMQRERSLSDVSRLKDCRIWQLRDDVDPLMKFVGFDELHKRGFGSLDADNYNCVYDGQVDTNNLDAIWDKFNTNHPPNYHGHSLSMSDVIELYDGTGSQFQYVDTFGFKQIGFEPKQEQAQDFAQSM